MADIPINKSRGKRYIGGASPIVPAYVQGDAPPPNNPPGSGSLGNFVTLDTTQTITGAKTFNNEVLEIDGLNPVVRIKNTSNNSILNFRNISNEDEGGLELIGADGKLKLVTRVNNTDIEIEPHGTGSIILPNVASGTPVSSLGLDVNNKVVASTAITQSFGTFTASLVDSGGGRTYSAVTQNSYYIKTGRFVYLSIYFGSVSSGGGSSTGAFRITGLPFSCSTDVTVPLEAVMTRVTGTTPSLDPKDISPTIASGLPNAISLSGTSPPIISGGQIALIISYLTD